MINNFVSSSVVIARVQRFFNDRNWISDAFMDLGDGIQMIGYATRKKDTVSKPIEIVNHKAEIPCELEYIIKVEDLNGNRIFVNKDETLSALCKDKYSWYGSGDWYDIKPPFIRTSFEEGKINIFYRTYEVDEEGYLLIPDIAAYKLALQWYIIQSLLLQGYKAKDTSINHSYAEAMFDKYKIKARVKSKSMSRDERERFSRMWTATKTRYVDSKYIPAR